MEFDQKIIISKRKPVFCFAFVFYSGLINNAKTNTAVDFLDFAAANFFIITGNYGPIFHWGLEL
jgi:hypothetical protein